MNYSLSDYELSQCINTDGTISLYRARFIPTDETCILKFPAYESAPEPAVSFLKNEYTVCTQINPGPVLRPSRCIRINNSTCVEFRDSSSIPLALSIGSGIPSLQFFFPQAMELVRIVANLHDCGIIHRNLSPFSFFRNRESDTLLVSGFYLATYDSKPGLPEPTALRYPPNRAYIAPEQTGKIDRTIDERVDLYALGTIFYEIITGTPPFSANDTTSLLYSHVAHEPEPIHARQPDVPRQLSEIIGKLLSKDPADRYQSARGLLADLGECRTDFINNSGTKKTFPLGSQDRCTRLLKPRKLYGRDKLLRRLREALKTSDRETATALFVSGEPGTGKSYLIEYFLSSLDRKHILVAQAKCGEESSTVPHHALRSAFSDLIRDLIARGNDTTAVWKGRFEDALRHNRELITEFIPELQMVIGPVPRKKTSSDTESGKRFRSIFVKFLQTFLQKETLLVLFVDDLQWADSAFSTILLPAFFENTGCRFLFIGTSREMYDDKKNLYQRIAASGAAVDSISLTPLSRDHSGHMIADALGASRRELREFETLVFSKTNGNPFFLQVFLEMLLSRGLLFHRKTPAARESGSAGSGWEWKSDEILQLSCTDNVIDIVIDKARDLPDDTRHTIDIASCLGMRFSSIVVGAIAGIPAGEAGASFTHAVNSGICIPVVSGDGTTPNIEFRFSHHRIRTAIYNRIDGNLRSRLHLKAGRTLNRMNKNGTLTTDVSDVVKHFNLFPDALESPEERIDIVNLNREAALYAYKSYAYDIAQNHLAASIRFLPESSWETHQELRFDLELTYTKCEYLLFRFETARKMLRELDRHAAGQQQLAAVDIVKMSILDHLGKPEESMKIGFRRLREMGIPLPERPSPFYLVIESIRAAFTAKKIAASDIRKSIDTVSDDITLSFHILVRLWLHSFVLQKQTVIIATATRLLKYARTHGLSGSASVAMCCWGIFIGMLTRNPRKGLRYGNMALALARRFDDRFSRGITFFFYGSFFAHLEGHLNNSIAILSDGRRYSYEAGDITSTSNSTEGHLLFLILSGKSLPEITQEAHEAIRFLEHIGVPGEGLNVPGFVHSWAESMKNSIETDDRRIRKDSENDTPMVAGIKLLFYMFRTLIAGDYAATLLIARQLKKNPILDPSSFFFFFYLFLHAIARSAVEDTTGVRRRKRRKFIKRHLSILKKEAGRSPVNLTPLHLLVAAEYHRLGNERWEALQCYRQSIEAAVTQGFIHYAALASERIALFLQEYQVSDSRTFIKSAMSFYYEWGAAAKVASLQKQFPEIPFNPHLKDLASGFSEIDLQALLRSFEAISNEIMLDRLLVKQIRIIMENMGAQRGALLIAEQETFTVRVEGRLTSPEDKKATRIETRVVNSSAERYDIPQGIISYVYRTREAVRLENALEKGRFVHDDNVKKSGVKSVLCVPLVSKERIRGIVYLEHGTLQGAFPQSRLQLLKLLCGQAVISLENALFHEMEIKHLLSKVNPHFIFNALSSIAELCHSDPDATEDAIVKLSALYRYILTSEMKLVTLEEELEITRSYLAIEKLRFGGRLSYDVTISGNPALVRMPSMLIQPLVENSIKHGISPRTSGGTILIKAAIDDSRCTISVEDNGEGKSSVTSGSGYGLASIRKRLALEYKDDAAFEISDTTGYRVTFSFPLQTRPDF